MIGEFIAPETVEEALAALAERDRGALVLAGGTDVMVRIRRGVVPPAKTALVSLHRIASLRGVSADGGRVRVGPATTAADLVRDPVVAERAPILAFVADRLASAQVREVATIGGNLANASPAGDLIVPLLLLDAELELRSATGTRTVAVADFFTGPGTTVLGPAELLTGISFPAPPPDRVFRFRKAGTRPSMECSVVTVGVAFTPREGVLRDVRVAYGSSAPVPLRGRAAEAALEGRAPAAEAIDLAVRAARDEVCPISDVRGSADYRRALVGEFLGRLVHGDD